MERRKVARRVGGFAALWFGLLALTALAWPAGGCGTLWPTGLTAAAGAGGGPSGPGETATDREEAARLAALEARCVQLDEGRLVWKGVAVGAGALATGASAATALTAGLADPEDAQWWSLGLGLGSLAFGGVALLGTAMESAVAEDFAKLCGELWLPPAPAPAVPTLEDRGAGPTLTLGEDGAIEAVVPPPGPEAPSPAAAPSSDVPGPEGTGTGSDGLLDDGGLAPGVP